jgi:DNA mismatch repair protein MutS
VWPRSLFATHYHELTELAVQIDSVLNLRMAVRESGDAVAFLHRVERGASDRSYGIHVARLAGIPLPVVERAREILENIERDEFGRDGQPRRARKHGALARRAAQASLFESEPRPDERAARVLEQVRRQDPDRLTPIEALGLIAAWRRELNEPEES